MKKNLKLALAMSSAIITNAAVAVDISQENNEIIFSSINHKSSQITVITPQNERFTYNFTGDEFSIQANQMGAKTFESGRYKFEISAVNTADELSSDVRKLNDANLSKEFSNTFEGQNQLVSGVFSIDNNMLLDQSATEEVQLKDQVFLDDLIVDGSACIGFDCVNGESFGFDTLRLKENNLRIKFDDTSAAGGFPSNDWQITINDSANGGANKFSIDDISGGRTPFTVEANAPSHSLYVDDGGRIGLGTSTPSVEIHAVDGDTPTLRLQQDGSSGFAPQTWDVAGNETSFFIRDATNGSTLPFRIRPGAPSNALVVDVDGDVGVGTLSPDSAFKVTRSDGTSSLAIEETNGTVADRNMMSIVNNGGSRLNFENTSGGANANNWRLGSENNTGSFIITEVGSGSIELEITTNGDILHKGVTVHTSDRNKKKNIVKVDSRKVLEKVSDLPISTWEYKDQENITHMGPMAQDFRAAFGLGFNDTTIANTDIIGVALASIKALKHEQDVRERELKELKATNTELEKRLSLLEAKTN